MTTSRRNLLFSLTGLTLLSFPLHARSDTPPGQQLSKAFQLGMSSDSGFAKGRDEQTFYVQLRAVNVRPDLNGQKCVDRSFLSFVRKWFSTESKRLALVATIAPPDGLPTSSLKVPLFEASMDETHNPPQCLTDVIISKPITPLYVATSSSDFAIDIQAQSQGTANTTIAKTVVSVASQLFSFGIGSAWLIQKDAQAQTAIQQATANIDQAVSNNWSLSNQQTYHLSVNAWPSTAGNWGTHIDQATFSIGSLIPTAGGIRMAPELIPTVEIGLRYVQSVFGTGPGHYNDEDGILSKKLTTTDGNSLSDIFALGLPGFTTTNAMAIANATDMSAFCGNMRTNFARFLTVGDRLAARHAVLRRRTNFYSLATLRTADGCMSDNEISKLHGLSAKFDVPSISRLSKSNRSAFVAARGTALVSPALLSGDSTRLAKIVSDPAKFTFSVSADVRQVFSDPKDGKKWGDLTGQEAINNLAQAGSFRSGCWQALPTQNLRNMVGMIMSKTTNQTAAALIEFDSDYAGAGSDPAADRGKVIRMTFLTVPLIEALAQLPSWPDSSCPLAQ